MENQAEERFGETNFEEGHFVEEHFWGDRFGSSMWHDNDTPSIPGSLDPQSLFYSPALSVAADGTPLMSPTDLRLDEPAPPDFSMPPSFYSPQVNSSPAPLPGNNSSSNVGIKRAPGKVVKQSPMIRPQPLTPATPASLMNLDLPEASGRQDEIEEKLNSAVLTTSRLPNQGRAASIGSIGSSHMSPPSRSSTPRIRPRPRKTSEGDKEALNRSNYQNLIEGTHRHLGFSEPDRLVSDLRNKKKSHKLAEQERRARINAALVDLGRLVTPEQPSNSKAVILEAAIQRINSLEMRVAELENRTDP